ncbi:hypothetical protein CAP36_13260 [Chitinophagaceae bacterium IBVUCB2]|nr:hypothetical protein CAP36_13260 [Chitinophagaceae bacterium IBVUCB2]
MHKFTLIIATFFLILAVCSQNTIRLEIKALPAYHSADDNIFAAGSFNSWNPQNQNYKFKKDEKGNYYLELKLNSGSYQYKITRGGWENVECTKDGAGIENRVFKIEGDAMIELSIAGWQDKFSSKPKLSSASKNVHIIETAFFIPQLNRNRRIWIYLPENYVSSKIKYPVLYIHDGQNVFEDSSSFSGEWGVDDFLDSTQSRNCIVVAIDNGGDKRMNEYNPYDNIRFGKGEGDAYVDFIANTLRPYINKNYRTLKCRKKTYVAGSSMGGLISMYAALKYPKIFGGAGVFSPSFWIAPEIYSYLQTQGKKVKSKIYFYAGKEEGESMVPDMLKAFEQMAKVSKSKMTTVIRDDGKHNEATWRNEFPLFYNWIR